MDIKWRESGYIRYGLIFHCTFDWHCFPLPLLSDWWFSARTNINWQILWYCLSSFADRFGVSDSVIFDTGRLLKYQQHFIHIPDRQPDELKERIHWWNSLKTSYLMTIQYTRAEWEHCDKPGVKFRLIHETGMEWWGGETMFVVSYLLICNFHFCLRVVWWKELNSMPKTVILFDFFASFFKEGIISRHLSRQKQKLLSISACVCPFVIAIVGLNCLELHIQLLEQMSGINYRYNKQ